MNPVGWLLDARVFPEQHAAMVAAIQRQGHQIVELNSPKAPYGWDDVNQAYRRAYPTGACVVTHADIDLVNRVCRDGRWRPGAFATLDNYHCSFYFAHLGRFLLNSDYTMLPFAELTRNADFLFGVFGRDDRIFVRPDSPLKLFAGMVASRGNWERDLEFMGFYEFPKESLVVVSSPKTIVAEWRYVVVNGKIVAGSQYKEGLNQCLRPAEDSSAQNLAEDILAVGFAPDPVWVFDICRTDQGTDHLLEIGAFSFANLYGCDLDAVVRAVSAAAATIHAAC